MPLMSKQHNFVLVKLCFQVHVDKGMNDGQKITFRGEGDQEVNVVAILQWHFKTSGLNQCYILQHPPTSPLTQKRVGGQFP